NEIEGSGPAGRVTPEDVQAFAKGETPARREAKAEEEEREPRAPRATGAPSGIPFFDPPPMPDFSKFGPVETEAFRSIRRKIAYRLATSAILIPHVPHLDEADVTELDKLRMEERERLADVPGGRLTLMPFLMRAVVSALKAYPRFNTSLDPDREELVYKKYYNVGVAADSPKGLVVPVVKDADRKSILELSAAIYDVGTRARDDKLEAADFQGGTFTITNIGPLGGLFAPPIINYPEVAILGVYKVQDKPVVRDGRIVIRKMMPIAVCFDHRVNDGADAARFLNHIIALIENPRRLLVEG
ncbi:2-oxo acid dehydrogenase subunit E2, partial [bacterium]|nr:2-oxo acid dehydrogenase subunit E2 [bacterium]